MEKVRNHVSQPFPLGGLRRLAPMTRSEAIGVDPISKTGDGVNQIFFSATFASCPVRPLGPASSWPGTWRALGVDLVH